MRYLCLILVIIGYASCQSFKNSTRDNLASEIKRKNSTSIFGKFLSPLENNILLNRTDSLKNCTFNKAVYVNSTSDFTLSCNYNPSEVSDLKLYF